MRNDGRNSYRKHEQTKKIQTLENALSWTERLFSRISFARGGHRLRRWFFMLLLALPFLLGGAWLVRYTIDKAYSMSIDNISYEGRMKIIGKEQALRILGIQGSVNMATLNAGRMEKTLEEHPCIVSAHIRAELPDTLSIEVEERIPLVYVEMEHAADTGERKRLFMDPNGVLFPVVEEYHENFLGLPVWYLQPGDVSEFREGAVIAEKYRRPIVDLMTASNQYSTAEIPPMREIFRPKEWKILVMLEGGTEVMMQVYGIKGQMERLAAILEHCRATKHKAQEINVIPRVNPTVRYAEEK